MVLRKIIVSLDLLGFRLYLGLDVRLLKPQLVQQSLLPLDLSEMNVLPFLALATCMRFRQA